MMCRFVAGLLGATAIGIVSASAADLPVKAPPPPIVPMYNWTGCYVGGQVGYGWGTDSDSETVTATGVPSPFSPATDANPNGAKLGGYVGCNWQVPASAFVLGVEGDGEWAGLKDSTVFTGTGVPADSYEASIRWEASLRGRVGYAFDRALLYATGGVAFANVNEHDAVGGGPSTDNASTRTGWTLGLGLDYAFTPNWIGRVEYRYADFGTFSYQPVVFPAFTENHKITENVIRFGLAYKFY